MRLHVQVHIHMLTCVHTHMHALTHAHILSLHMLTPAHTRAFIHGDTLSDVYIDIRALMLTCTHIHSNTHTYTHTSPPLLSSQLRTSELSFQPSKSSFTSPNGGGWTDHSETLYAKSQPWSQFL